MKNWTRYFIPVGIGLLASILLAGVYLGLVSWAESLEHALDLFWEDRLLVIPILLGFGIQAALYTILKMRLYLPVTDEPAVQNAAPAASIGAGGATSTLAMAACCAHHVTDVLPLLGLTAAATFLARYQTAFMTAGLVSNLVGIGVIGFLIIRARQAAFSPPPVPVFVTEDE